MDNIVKITMNDKCFKCGACISVCPKNVITKKYNSKTGFYDICVNEDRCINCTKCLKICPAENNKKRESYIGKYKEIKLASAINNDVRKNATSGGVINSIIRHLLDNKIIDGAIVVKEDNSVENRSSVTIINSSKELEDRAREFSSRYVSVSICECLNKLEKDKKYVLVGAACHIAAARKVVGQNNNIIFLGIACSGGMSYNATLINAKKTNRRARISNVYYRGSGWPGKNMVKYEDGTIKNQDHLTSDFNAIFTSQILKNKACRNCHDQLAEESDISFFDFWNEKEKKEEKIGKSGVIIRSEIGEKVYKATLCEGYIQEEKEVREEDVINSQRWILTLKKDILDKPKLLKFYYCIIDFLRNSSIYKIMPIWMYKILSKFFLRLVRIYQNNKR